MCEARCEASGRMRKDICQRGSLPSTLLTRLLHSGLAVGELGESGLLPWLVHTSACYNYRTDFPWHMRCAGVS